MTTLPLGKSSSSGLFAATCSLKSARNETDWRPAFWPGDPLASLMGGMIRAFDPGILGPGRPPPLAEVAQGLGETATEPGIEPQARQLVPTEPSQVGGLLLGAPELAHPRHHQVAKIEVGMGRLARARRNLVHVDVERPRGAGMETGVLQTRLLAH